MEGLKIVWHQKARGALHKAMWYLFNCSQSYADTFIDNVKSTVLTASRMPTIGHYKKAAEIKHTVSC
ncbi:hypothetical protein Bache_2907 [Bacteroides helcogenes P 36-108]|uniref:Uncharacterized protein n=1 Tax=Bacteroides helcogenes (strain ATCC 35417 / DSM 20613 / JCM 6297 / CCUG 15421 / P 36-108) TaxID=693979 RepID=E6SP85_BACT6|nr:hypothetical protein Bache_2907 [Bacteroides helcogenes P 36-108]